MIIFKFQPLMIYADMLQPWAVPCERLESRIANRAALSHGKKHAVLLLNPWPQAVFGSDLSALSKTPKLRRLMGK